MSAYVKFLKELRDHSAEGYHVAVGPVDEGAAMPHFPRTYVEFLKTVGPGYFFAGALKFYHPSKTFPPHLHESVNSARRLLGPGLHSELLPIGDCGVLSEVLCLEANAGSKTLLLLDIHSGESRILTLDFHDWVESQPKKLFRAKVYKAFGPVKDARAIERIIQARNSFSVSLLTFDRALVRPPGREADFLPRYNRIRLRLEKRQEVLLGMLTLSVFRTGSEIGAQNREFITIDVSQLEKGKPVEVEAFVFDPFNLPFDAMQVTVDDPIDLKSPMRVRYKEIGSYL